MAHPEAIILSNNRLFDFGYGKSRELPRIATVCHPSRTAVSCAIPSIPIAPPEMMDIPSRTSHETKEMVDDSPYDEYSRDHTTEIALLSGASIHWTERKNGAFGAVRSPGGKSGSSNQI